MTTQEDRHFSVNRLLLLVGLIALGLLIALWLFWPSAQQYPQTSIVPPPPVEPRDVVLYFADAEGLYLVSEEQQIAGCNDERQCIAQTLESLAAGSQRLQAVIPRQTRVLGVEVEENTARINFSRELIDRHPGGSLSELLTVYGLANTLAVNFPYLHSLQILVDGKELSTLKGHVDISRPIKSEFRYSQAPAESRLDERGAGSEPPSEGSEK